jgi:hypothetical protein
MLELYPFDRHRTRKGPFVRALRFASIALLLAWLVRILFA